MAERKKAAVKEMMKIAEEIYEDFNNSRIPELKVPSRTKSNIAFDGKYRVWKYGNNMSTRSVVSLSGAYMLLRTTYTIDFIKKMIEQNKSSTLRELYYISEGWGEGKFSSQGDSDRLAEDLEILTKKLREDMSLRPEEDGARVMGDLVIEEITRKGEKRIIHCQDDVGDSGYSIPYNVEKEKLKIKGTNAKIVMAVETGGMFDRLVENGFDENKNTILVHLKGQPARSTRRFIKRLNEEKKLPIIVFTDGDPWSYRIFASVAYGAIKTAHISEYLATPSAEFLGITPSDILNYELPTDDLTNEDVSALKAELSDPRFRDDFWESEIKLQLKMKKKSEQQALAKYGLDYVTDKYLPEKLAEMGYEV
ncbi:MAG: DNA topoisomerase IV subunit A [Candidatus Thermoplasmatota archaeon]|nr:DNA topoisomerase IV subunit A [Candidatus Thermoplasmatota archaeon]